MRRWIEPVTLEGRHVRLEPLTLDHVPGIAAAAACDSDPALAQLFAAVLRARDMTVRVELALARTQQAVVAAHRHGPVRTARRFERGRCDITAVSAPQGLHFAPHLLSSRFAAEVSEDRTIGERFDHGCVDGRRIMHLGSTGRRHLPAPRTTIFGRGGRGFGRRALAFRGLVLSRSVTGNDERRRNAEDRAAHDVSPRLCGSVVTPDGGNPHTGWRSTTQPAQERPFWETGCSAI